MDAPVRQWIEIDDTTVETKGGEFEGQNGQLIKWQNFKQTAYLFTKGVKYPEPTVIKLEKGQAPYPAGKYVFGSALSADKSGIVTKKYIPLLALKASEKKTDPS